MPFLLRVLQHGWELLGKLSTVCMSFGLPQDVRKLTRGLCWATSGFLLGCFGLRYHPRKVPTSLCAGTFYQTLFLGGFSILLCTALCLPSQWYQQPLQKPRGMRGDCKKPLLAGHMNTVPAQEGEGSWGVRSSCSLLWLHCSRCFVAEEGPWMPNMTLRVLRDNVWSALSLHHFPCTHTLLQQRAISLYCGGALHLTTLTSLWHAQRGS